MKIDTQPLEDHQVKLTVEVEPDLFESAKRHVARQLARRTKIPGFRPGKAPYPVIVRQIGEAVIVEEALENLVNDIYPKVIEEAKVTPYGPGKLENVVSMEPPVLEFVVPLQAEVTLGDFKAIQHPYEVKKVTDKDIQNVLDGLLERQAVLEPVDRPVEEGDVVFVKISGKRTHPEEDQDPTLIQERSARILVRPEDEAVEEHVEDEDGEDTYQQEWPFPGFSRLLIGLNAGDEHDFTHQFSDDTVFENLRGVEAEYHVLIEDVKKRTLPELNDEFANSVGEYETLEDLRSDIRDSLQHQREEDYNDDYDKAILEQAVEQTVFKYPPQMLENEIDNVIDGLKNRLERQNLDLELYLKTREMDMEGLREEARSAAVIRLKRSLFLLELAKAENIELSPEEVQRETIRTVGSLSEALPKKEARRLGDRAVINNLVDNIMLDMMSEKALDRFREIASGGQAAKKEPGSDDLVERTLVVEPEAESGSKAESEVETFTTEQVEPGTKTPEMNAETGAHAPEQSVSTVEESSAEKPPES